MSIGTAGDWTTSDAFFLGRCMGCGEDGLKIEHCVQINSVPHLELASFELIFAPRLICYFLLTCLHFSRACDFQSRN